MAVDPVWLAEVRHRNQVQVGLARAGGPRPPVGMGLGRGLGYGEDLAATMRARNAEYAKRAAQAHEIELAKAVNAGQADQVVLPLPTPSSLPKYLLYGAAAIALVGVVGAILKKRRS